MQEDDAGRKEVKEKEAGSRKQEVENQAHTVLTLGLDQITKIMFHLDVPLGEGNV
jgi:hypothetical protein